MMTRPDQHARWSVVEIPAEDAPPGRTYRSDVVDPDQNEDRQPGHDRQRGEYQAGTPLALLLLPFHPGGLLVPSRDEVERHVLAELGLLTLADQPAELLAPGGLLLGDLVMYRGEARQGRVDRLHFVAVGLVVDLGSRRAVLLDRLLPLLRG